MATGKSASWMKLVAGLVVGATTNPLFMSVVPIAVSGSTLLSAPMPAVTMSELLNSAIGKQQQGDYAGAAVLIQQLYQHQDALTESERLEFSRCWEENTQAIDARREGTRQLRIVEKALQDGRGRDAGDLLKKVAPSEPYLLPEDKTKYKTLAAQLQKSTPGAPATESTKPIPVTPTALPTKAQVTQGKADLVQARTKLQQARTQLTQANIDQAEQLARETERLGVTYPPAEDTPAKLLQDIAKARGDAKTLLVAARAAMGRNEFPAAEKYAKQSEAVAGTFTFTLASDTPAKVLKELKDLQGTEPKAAVQPPVKTVQAKPTEQPSPSPSRLDSMKNFVGLGGSAEKPAKVDTPKVVDKPTASVTTSTKPATPTLEASKPAADKVVQVSDTKTQTPAKPLTKEDAIALVKTGRKQLAENKLEDAQVTALKARAIKNVSWGIFDDSPESLLKEVEKARLKRDQEESVKVLAEGRKLLDKKDWEGAQRAAYQAQKLHGPYQFYEMGDRPDKLLTDSQKLRGVIAKSDIVVVKKDDKKPEPVTTAKTPAASPTIQAVSTLPPATPERKPEPGLPPLTPPAVGSKPPVEVPSLPPVGVTAKLPTGKEAKEKADGLQMLGAARTALKAGDPVKAKLLADLVADMKLNLLPGEDSPAAVYADIERAAKPGAPTAATTPSLPPVPRTGPALPPQTNATPTNAQQLLAEGRQFQKSGKLLEARLKCLEANTSGAAFSTDEDTPTQALKDLATAAKRRMEVLSAQATETAAYGTGDALARYQQAEKMLQEARALAQGYGLDPDTIDAKLSWLHEVQAQATGVAIKPPPVKTEPAVIQQTNYQQPAPAPTPTVKLPTEPERVAMRFNEPELLPLEPVRVPVTPAPAPMVAAVPQLTAPAPLPPAVSTVNQGQKLLEQARNELRANALVHARQLAMDAMKEEYGVAAEAAAVLRSVDTESVAQKAHADGRTFDAAESAFRRKDYSYASVLIGQIDTHNLDAPRKERLREIMQTPGMQTNQPEIVAVGEQRSSLGQEATLNPATRPEEPGHSRATDTPGTSPQNDILSATASLRNVLFQKLRSDGLKAQNDANEKFRAGETDQALDLLKNYLASLETVQNLDPNQVTLLRRPVESRLKHFELTKLQEDFQKQDKLASSGTLDRHKKEQVAEEVKQKKVADLMKQCTALVKDGKLDDAYRMAMVIREMDPDNPSVEALVLLSKTKRAVKDAADIKGERENAWLTWMNDADRVGPAVDSKNPEAFDPESLQRSKKRGDLRSILQRKSPDMIEMERKLMTPVNINFRDVTMRQALEDLSAQHAFNIHIDSQSLLNAGVSADRTVNVKMEGVMLRTAIELLLKDQNLSYIVKDRYIEVTTKENAKGLLVRMTYPVTDLIVPVENSIASPGAPASLNQQNNANPSGNLNPQATGYSPTPIANTGFGISGTGTPVGTPLGVQGTSDADNGMPGSYGQPHISKRRMQTREDVLIRLIMNTISPLSWAEAGGTGTIDYFPMAGALVINQSLDIQEQVADLLQALRRLQDQEVAIEVRLITVDEDYYEKIGLDFSLNISTNNRNLKYQPALNTGQFAPQNYINSPIPTLNGLLSGLTPAGTLTPDLGIPIAPNSFNSAIPPFGGYQGPGVGGLSLGLAFLSDIQVSMLLEAVAGDSRSSVSQSPRVTLQNGEQAFIRVQDNLENLVTNVQLTQLPSGGYAVVPVVSAINNDALMQISAVITADRRFVRLSPTLHLVNYTTSNPQPPTPILLPIYPSLSPAEPGQSVVYTQYIQQPQRSSTLDIQTTVTVPDGGTVVMGGLKRMAEGRLEYGPPVLSKIPYINRLFRNVSYGRSGTSILILVTPRIIIQEEEEERATGFTQGTAAGVP